jgi:hypothetical protein
MAALSLGSAAVPCRKKVNATAFRHWRSLVAGARYLPNTQLLSIPFRSELIHEAA